MRITTLSMIRYFQRLHQLSAIYTVARIIADLFRNSFQRKLETPPSLDLNFYSGVFPLHRGSSSRFLRLIQIAKNGLYITTASVYIYIENCNKPHKIPHCLNKSLLLSAAIYQCASAVAPSRAG